MTQPLPETSLSWCADAYGGPEVLHLRPLPLRPPRNGEITVQVEAATVSSGDVRIRSATAPRGFGRLMRLAFGLRRPRQPVLGGGFTGRVVAAGAGAGFRPGDRVMGMTGMRLGCHAEFVTLPCAKAVAVPWVLSAEEAASLTFGGTAALHFLGKAAVKPGDRVLLIGTTGAIGVVMLQRLVALGAHVTAMCSADGAELARSLGAERVLDYRTHTPEALPGPWDVVADIPGATTLPRIAHRMAQNGRFLALSATLREVLRRRYKGRLNIAGTASESPELLAELAQLAASGALRPVIGHALPFEALRDAYRRAETGPRRGAVLLLGPHASP